MDAADEGDELAPEADPTDTDGWEPDMFIC
jgi:hypothetical protein